MTEKDHKAQKDRKVDEAGRESFPASDPASIGKPTGTETPASPPDRQATVPSREDIEAARRGDGHKQG